MKPHECRCGMFEPHKTKTECIAELTAQLQKAEAALANDPARRFGLLCLSAWWNEGQPGDIDGADVQDYADRAGLWHHVDRHADGVECEWCGNDGSGCGELTDAGERAWAEAEDVPVRSAPSRIDELSMLLRESNAVCLCGCPESDHEHSPEGSSCDYDSHECVRASRAALDYATRLRAALAEERERRERAERRVGEYAADATLFARERDITTEKLGKAEARLRQIEEATRDSGIGPAAAAWNLAADYCRAAPAQPTCLCPWPEQDASPRHRPDCNAAQPAPYGAARGKGVQ